MVKPREFLQPSEGNPSPLLRDLLTRYDLPGPTSLFLDSPGQIHYKKCGILRFPYLFPRHVKCSKSRMTCSLRM